MRIEQARDRVDVRVERLTVGDYSPSGTPLAPDTRRGLEQMAEGTGVPPDDLFGELMLLRAEFAQKLHAGDGVGETLNGLSMRTFWLGYEFGHADGYEPNAELREQLQHLRGAYHRATESLLKALVGLEQIPLMVGTKRRGKAALELLREIREAL